MSTQMSLHRIIASIKHIEESLAQTNGVAYIYHHKGDINDVAKKAEKDSQVAFDKTIADIRKLAILKAARNKANATTFVTIANKQYTIDEALARKASIAHELNLIGVIKNQFAIGQRNVDNMNTELEKKFAEQLKTMYNGGTSPTQADLDNARIALEKVGKGHLVHAPGLKENISRMEEEIKAFNLEVDYVLSEVNATTIVDVVF